jgi:hypothetical protein
VFPNINKSADFGNCCFPTYLSSKYERVNGAGFQELGNRTKSIVPDGELMVGHLTQKKNDCNTLVSPLYLRINCGGKDYDLTITEC